jgi:hypothetical protein
MTTKLVSRLVRLPSSVPILPNPLSSPVFFCVSFDSTFPSSFLRSPLRVEFQKAEEYLFPSSGLEDTYQSGFPYHAGTCFVFTLNSCFLPCFHFMLFACRFLLMYCILFTHQMPILSFCSPINDTTHR